MCQPEGGKVSKKSAPQELAIYLLPTPLAHSAFPLPWLEGIEPTSNSRPGRLGHNKI